jgi:hypothetical protein
MLIMRLFRRRPADSGRSWPEPNMSAVPLTLGEAQLLIHSYHEDDRLNRAYFWAHTGSAYALGQAQTIVKAVALAGALGHKAVPAPVQDISMLDTVLYALEKWDPHARTTSQFRLLMLKMQGLSALCKRNDWRYKYDRDAGAIRWVKPPVIDGLPGFPEIEA